jgi:hypothetical protein
LGSAQVVTGDRGEARFTGIAGGSYGLSLQLPGGLEAASVRPVPLKEGATERLTVRVGEFDRSISGQIRDRDGPPLPGIEVEAVPVLRPGEVALIPVGRSRQRAVSDSRGAYEIKDLVDGEYELRTMATQTYPAASRIARAGVTSFDLVLDKGRQVRVYGQVRTRDGRLLEGVRVSAVGQSGQHASTGKDGAYSIALQVAQPQRVYTLHFSLAGYRESDLRIHGEDIAETAEWKLDAELDPPGSSAPVSGVITAADGTPVAGETIYLHSSTLDRHLEAVGGENGEYLFPDVEVGEDYRLWIYPNGDFKDFVLTPVDVPPDGLAQNVVLEPLGFGRIAGRMVDGEGHPISGLSLRVRSAMAMSKSFSVTGDDMGRFQLDRVPEGELSFESRSLPRFSAQGVELPAGAEREVSLVIDSGTHVLSGSVTDLDGAAITAARVELRWELRKEGIRYRSYRNTVADKAGRFTFIQLGAGPHTLKVMSRGYATMEITCEAGSEKPLPPVRLSPAKR